MEHINSNYDSNSPPSFIVEWPRAHAGFLRRAGLFRNSLDPRAHRFQRRLECGDRYDATFALMHCSLVICGREFSDEQVEGFLARDHPAKPRP